MPPVWSSQIWWHTWRPACMCHASEHGLDPTQYSDRKNSSFFESSVSNCRHDRWQVFQVSPALAATVLAEVEMADKKVQGLLDTM